MALIEGERDTGRVSSNPMDRRAGCLIGTTLHRSMLKTEAQLAGNSEKPNPSRARATAVARAMLIGENAGFAISPVVPSVYLALALAGVELRKHIAFTFFWAWGVSLVMLAFAVAIGVVQV